MPDRRQSPSSDGGSTSVNADMPTRIVAVAISSTRVSPAEVGFRVVDPEGDSATVEIRFTTDNTIANSKLIATRSVAGSDGAGTAVSQSFSFEGEIGAQLTKDVVVFAIVAGESEFNQGVNATIVDLGNDAPMMNVDAAPVAVGAEASGPLPADRCLKLAQRGGVRARRSLEGRDPGSGGHRILLDGAFRRGNGFRPASL